MLCVLGNQLIYPVKYTDIGYDLKDPRDQMNVNEIYSVAKTESNQGGDP